MPMASKHTNICSAPFVIRKMLINEEDNIIDLIGYLKYKKISQYKLQLCNSNAHLLLVEMKNNTTTLEDSIAVF